MRVLVTGGAGFIGRHTCNALVRVGYNVRVLDNLDPQIHGIESDFPEDLLKTAECIKGDVRSISDCVAALTGVDMVIHLASKTGVGQSMYDVKDYIDTNVLGTGVLLEAIIKSKVQLKRLVLASSRAVYGEGIYTCAEHGEFHPEIRERKLLEEGKFEVCCPQCGLPMQAKPTSEKCNVSPLSVYAWTKVHQENYFRWVAETFSIPIVLLRYFNVFGLRQSLNNPYTGVVSIFFNRLKTANPVFLYENGLPIRDFVNVSDVVQANLLALENSNVIGEVFNIGSGESIRIKEIALKLAKLMGIIHPSIEDQGEFRVGDVFACYADLTKSRLILGFSPEKTLEDGLKEFIDWARNEPMQDYYHKSVEELDRYGLFGRHTLNE